MSTAVALPLLGLARAGNLAMLAESADRVPDHGRWIMEPKYDGGRLLVGREDGRTLLIARSGNGHAGKLEEIERELAALPDGTWLDCELVGLVLREGRIECDWGAAQSIMSSNSTTPAQRERVTLMVFDVLAHGGVDARPLRFEERRSFLEAMFDRYDFERVALTAQLAAFEDNHDVLVAQGFEGSMIKDLEAPYRSGTRSARTLRMKASDTADVVVTGWTPAEGGFTGMVGSLDIAQWRDGALVSRGAVGTGWSIPERRALTERVDEVVGTVVEVRHMGVLGAGPFRHPAFMRYRADKRPEDCDWRER